MSLFNSAAWGQQTPAAKLMAAKRSGRSGGVRSARRRKRLSRGSRSVARPKRRTKRSTRARLVKGSPAAKRYMASIRRKRRKR